MRGALAQFARKRAQLRVDILFDDFDFVDSSAGRPLLTPSDQLKNNRLLTRDDDFYSPVFEISSEARERAQASGLGCTRSAKAHALNFSRNKNASLNSGV
jgi:hypothetical protein